MSREYLSTKWIKEKLLTCSCYCSVWGSSLCNVTRPHVLSHTAIKWIIITECRRDDLSFNGVVPRCFYSQRSSQLQETAPMNSSLWQSAENKSNNTTDLDNIHTNTHTHTHDSLSDFKNVDSHDALTPTTRFMASSLSDSLLLSSISLRSSFLRTDRQTDRIVTDSLWSTQQRAQWALLGRLH